MTRDEVQDRFLVMGFQRRVKCRDPHPAAATPWGARESASCPFFPSPTRVEVHTLKTGAPPCAFLMEVEEIRRQIQRDPQGRYQPPEIKPQAELTTHGTHFVLTDLQRRHTIRTVPALRKRLAPAFFRHRAPA